MTTFAAQKNAMKIKLLAFILSITTYAAAQTAEYIIGPEGYGLEAPYTDRGMIPTFITGDDMFAFTRKVDASTNVPRSYLIRRNLVDGSMYVYDGIQLSGTADFYSPVNFTDHDGYVYFRSASKIYRVNKATNEIAIYIADCEHYYIWGNRILYDMWNSSKTFVRNMTNNSQIELFTATSNRNIIAVDAFYEHEGSVYFWGTASWFGARQNGIFKFNPATNTLSTFVLYTLQSSSNMYQGRREVTRVNDNLVFLIKDSTYNNKYVAVNLTTQMLNADFTFDTNSVYDSGVSEPFVIGSQVYIPKDGLTYVSDGVSAPQVSDIGGFGGGWFMSTYNDFLSYNDVVYTNRDTQEFGSEIWRTDGTPEGTYILADLEQGEGDAFYNTGLATVYAGTMYFCTTSGSSRRLYSSDGTTDGTLPMTEADEFSNFGLFKGYMSDLYFYGLKENGPNGLYKIGLGTLEVPSAAASGFAAYPNPAQSILNFSSTIERATVYDGLGRLVMKNINAGSIDVSAMSRGIYYLKGQSEGKSVQLKFIVQ